MCGIVCTGVCVWVRVVYVGVGVCLVALVCVDLFELVCAWIYYCV
jgi:hypothetical protein